MRAHLGAQVSGQQPELAGHDLVGDLFADGGSGACGKHVVSYPIDGELTRAFLRESRRTLT